MEDTVIYLILVGANVILLWLLDSKSNAYRTTQDELNKLKKEIPEADRYRQRVMAEADSYRAYRNSETDKICLQKLKEAQKQQELVQSFVDRKISAFPELAAFLADVETAIDKMRARKLEIKSRPAPKAAEEVRAVKQEKWELIKRNKALEWELRYIRRIVPWLDEIEDLPMEPVNTSEEYINPEYNSHGDGSADVDNAGYWLTPQEYSSLSTAEKNQLALNRYNKRRKTNAEIGRDYERYIGYLFEQKGFRVQYTGINEGMNDLGRDLICVRSDKTFVVQCKCWSNKQGKVIREKHINQIYGTAFKYYLEQRNKCKTDFVFGRKEDLFTHEILPMFVSTVPLSETACDFAKELGIEFRQIALGDYPAIKCNINSKGEKIYHLPFDQMYDKTDVSKVGEFYAMTTAEAESKGFRRAKKWKGN